MQVYKKEKKTKSLNNIMFGTSLIERTYSFKYLGVTISSTLSWTERIHNICTKARKVIGILYHHFYLNADTTSLLQLYLSLVRPILDYACQVWHPHLIKDIQKLESVQKFALRLCTKQWNLDYESLLMICNILTLSARRKFFCLCTMFKIIYKLIYFLTIYLNRESMLFILHQTCYFPNHLLTQI